MKRYGHLFEKVLSFQTLVNSSYAAARGKKKKPGVARFIQNLENEVIDLEKELETKTYHPRPYHVFMVHDPKERRICAANFRDRVVHHAACSVIEPVFERLYIYDAYACRKGKGTHRAMARAQVFCRRYSYFLKLDVYKFFDSIDHNVLKMLLRKKIKDGDLLWLLDIFIDHPVPWTLPGKGIPIGNLTSQHFANFYLSGLDHFVKEILRIKGYIRYMDDLVLFADDKDALWDAKMRIDHYLEDKLRIKCKPSALLLAPVFQGLPFLGFRIFPGVVRVSRKGWRRFRQKVMRLDIEFERGEIEMEKCNRSMAGLLGHLKQANTRNLRAPFLLKARGD